MLVVRVTPGITRHRTEAHLQLSLSVRSTSYTRFLVEASSRHILIDYDTGPQSSRFLSRGDGCRTWCRRGEEGRDVESPNELADSIGFGTANLSPDGLGVCIGSMVVFS